MKVPTDLLWLRKLFAVLDDREFTADERSTIAEHLGGIIARRRRS